MVNQLEKARALVRQYGQEHLLNFYKELSAAEQADLLKTLLSLDWELVASLYQNLIVNPQPALGEAKLAPLIPWKWRDYDQATRQKYQDRGRDLLYQGKAAVVLVAGGQGTRLGHPGPKGAFNIGLPSQKSLFQLQAERLLNLARQAGRTIPWYIMTSAANHSETTTFFAARQCFGYPATDLCFFQQEQLPVLDAAGKILLAAPGQVSLGPNGNGGCFTALEKSGALADMKRRGVEWVFLYGVDNALARVGDPAFLGITADHDFPAAAKVAPKTDPRENVGVLCYRNGRPAIIEYTEIPPELAAQRDPAENLLYGNANILSYLFRRDFLEENARSGLPYHVAHKKIATIDANGHPALPNQANAYKFELFMFDIFPRLPKIAALQVERAAEFAPVKNRTGPDSPETACDLLYRLHQQWLAAAGVAPQLYQGRNIEISPLLSYAGEGLDQVAIEDYLRRNQAPAVEVS
jgi:UDP-N-acetylglucosamine/UDP-N-acetylgalactosamine diphosphorylase